MSTLVQTLPDGPLDLVGDVHGELEALRALIGRLGGDPDTGRLQRPLVFLGDLVDRGPDSPGVVRLVRRLCQAGQAFCVAGNHELNLLQGERKEGNGWFFGDADDGYQWRDERGQGHHLVFDSVVPSGDEAADLRTFLDGLPLVLLRDDLRVVHACWHAASVAALPREGEVGALANAMEARVDERLEAQGLLSAAAAERAPWLGLKDPGLRPDRHLPAEQERNARQQNDNPFRVLTSGLEQRIEPGTHFFVGGRWRFVARAPWWQDYDEEVAVVVGHYWRLRQEPIPGKVDVFQAPSPWHWAGPRGTVFCVDYSVGRRFLQRARGGPGPLGYSGGLAALRWPERTVVFDDRTGAVPTVGYGGR
ncbi:metallophosphoesterase [Myxococcota bacterium]|nr:metallophosphoesterase [Myxococcota bacterium]